MCTGGRRVDGVDGLTRVCPWGRRVQHWLLGSLGCALGGRLVHPRWLGAEGCALAVVGFIRDH